MTQSQKVFPVSFHTYTIAKEKAVTFTRFVARNVYLNVKVFQVYGCLKKSSSSDLSQNKQKHIMRGKRRKITS